MTEVAKTNKKLVPKLRFKEFDEEWVKSKLGVISKITTGSTPSTSVNEFYNGDYLFVSPADMQGNRFIKNTKTTLTDAGFSKCRKLKKGSVLFVCIGSTIGKVAQTIEECSSNQQINALEAKENYSNDFIFTLLERNGQRIKLLAGVQAVPQINKTDFSNFKYLLPSLPEQQKTASFLSAVDNKIQQLTKKKALLEQYKKGVMQQLFSGKLRFKDDNGNPYPDWEKKIFSDLYSFHSTNSLSRDKLNYDAGSVYNIHYGDIHTKFKTAFKLNEAYIPFVNEDVDLSKIKDDSYCKSGDLVMADASEDYADIGKTIELIDLKDKNVLAGLHTFLARPITSKTTVGFFSVLLKSWSMRKQIMVIAQGTKVLSLSTTRVGKLKLKLPVIEEQQKIATYLSRIDTKIESVNNQITQTQTFKKGLLQQMFV
jgi:type I restriction enzyme S subunit